MPSGWFSSALVAGTPLPIAPCVPLPATVEMIKKGYDGMRPGVLNPIERLKDQDVYSRSVRSAAARASTCAPCCSAAVPIGTSAARNSGLTWKSVPSAWRFWRS